ncbi:MAG: aspartate-alanine antiporter [Phycisphaerales bacterium]
MHTLVSILRDHPSLGVFLALAAGFLLGTRRIGRFSLGTVVCTLLAAVVIGQSGAKVNVEVRDFFFNLFLFAIGYKVAPQFFGGLRREAIPQFVLATILSGVALLAAISIGRLLGYDKGTAAGLFAGAMTQSSAVGSASDAIEVLDATDEVKRRLLDHLAIGYATTYVFGTAGLAFFLSRIGPRLAGGDLREACRAQERLLGGGGDDAPSVQSAYAPLVYLAYVAAHPSVVGRSVAAIEAQHAGRVTIERLRRGGATGAIEPATPETVVRAGDIIAVAASRSEVIGPGFDPGEEVDDRALLDFPLETLDVVVTQKALDGATIEDVMASHGRGVRIHRLIRTARRVPLLPKTTLSRGDMIGVIGARCDVERFATAVGYPDRHVDSIDMVYVGLGLAAGVLFGIPSLHVFGIALGLSAAGALIAGLVFGYLRARHPTFGRFPSAAEWVFESLGLHIFVAIVGLNSGPAFVEGLRRDAVSLLFAGAVVTIVPHAVTILCGRWFFRMNPGVLLGVSAGSGASTAGLIAIEEEAQSTVPVLGYSVTYAVGTVLLTTCGALMVALG